MNNDTNILLQELNVHVEAMYYRTLDALTKINEVCIKEFHSALQTTVEIVDTKTDKNFLERFNTSADSFFDDILERYIRNREDYYFDFSPFQSGLNGYEKLFTISDNDTTHEHFLQHLIDVKKRPHQTSARIQYHSSGIQFYKTLGRSEHLAYADLATMLKIDRTLSFIIEDIIVLEVKAERSRSEAARTTKTNALTPYKTQAAKRSIDSVFDMIVNGKEAAKNFEDLA